MFQNIIGLITVGNIDSRSKPNVIWVVSKVPTCEDKLFANQYSMVHIKYLFIISTFITTLKIVSIIKPYQIVEWELLDRSENVFRALVFWHR